MSAEIITIIVATLSVLGILGGGLVVGFQRVLRRLNEGFASINAQFQKLDEQFHHAHESLAAVRAQVRELQPDLHDGTVSTAALQSPAKQLVRPHRGMVLSSFAFNRRRDRWTGCSIPRHR